jgi:4-hydroxy-3-polyprenylbenzoate decarboxylase
MKVVVAITGASGVIYGTKLIEVLKEKKIDINCIVSNAGKIVIKHEGMTIPKRCYSEQDISASISSGSYIFDSMVIAPCSMKTLGAIANGYASNLITRTADVAIKEGRKLVIVPRETPLSSIHLENMFKLSKIGVIILPAMPAFYTNPKQIDDMVNFIVGKILDSLFIKNEIYKRWGK